MLRWRQKNNTAGTTWKLLCTVTTSVQPAHQQQQPAAASVDPCVLLCAASSAASPAPSTTSADLPSLLRRSRAGGLSVQVQPLTGKVIAATDAQLEPLSSSTDNSAALDLGLAAAKLQQRLVLPGCAVYFSSASGCRVASRIRSTVPSSTAAGCR